VSGTITSFINLASNIRSKENLICSMKTPSVFPLVLLLHAHFLACFQAHAASAQLISSHGEQNIANYFRAETAKLSGRCLADIKTLHDWTSRRAKYREELLEMLGLWPSPEPADLKPVVTGKIEAESFIVDKLHFQSMPGLYVTANLYLPKNLTKPAPTVLYLCGHALVVKDGVSYGNKVGYQHHGAWFAQHGYVCLIIDTLQLGEIQGLHHGTYREGMWWWNSRGYTPAGVEAWNSIRALDYLETRPEVDAKRFGVTGRSGGGAYSWFTAALDDRIKVAAPVAGITDLQNHVVDGRVEGHCDCMFIVNTYRWDYAQVAALVAPRPLLICNTDRDSIFPLDGVLRVHDKVRRLYQLYGASTNLGLVITEGPHKDTQDLQVPVFRWFNRFLKGEDPLIEVAAKKHFEPEQLKVFDKLPEDQKNKTIQETFVPMAKPASVPVSTVEWTKQRDTWMATLKEKVFAGWPEEAAPLELKEHLDIDRHGVRFRVYDFVSQPEIPLRLYLMQPKRFKKPERILLNVLDDAGWDRWIAGMRHAFANELDEERRLQSPDLARSPDRNVPEVDPAYLDSIQQSLRSNNWAMAFVAPRGVGLTQWRGDAKKQAQIRRRFMLLGQTLEGMRVWDTRRAVQAVRSVTDFKNVPLWVRARGTAAVNVLYASLFEKNITGLELSSLPKSHRANPDYLNVLRVFDMPQAVAMAAEHSQIRLIETDGKGWEYPINVIQRLGGNENRFRIEALPSGASK
jgi:dienelactone hydrolase